MPTATAPTLLLFRSVACGHKWDRFESKYDHSTGAQYTLHARAAKHESNMTPDAHITMGYGGHHVMSPYISFTSDLHWGVYYHLLEEYFRTSGRPGRSRSLRQLYAIQVVAADISHFSFELQRARAFAGVAHEMLGHGQVRVVDRIEVYIPERLKEWSTKWFASQHHYPYQEWRCELFKEEHGKMHLDMIDGFVALWKQGTMWSQEQAARVPLPVDVDEDQS